MKSESILVLAMVVLLAASASAGTYSGGDGSAEYPYRIATPNDLNEVGDNLDDWNKNFVLTNDINMADYTYSTALIAPDTNNSNIEFDGIPFIGVFEGNDFCIRNFSIDAQGTGNDYLGLLGKTNSSAIIENLGFEDSNITGGYSYFLGGLCGRNYGTISNCYTTGAVSAQDDSGWIGGLCGLNYGTISNCYATGSVSADNSEHLGGLAGYNNDGTIINCNATGSVSGENSDSLGGLCGWKHEGMINNCYATGSVTGDDFLGGLCGGSSYGTISNCYATGSVDGFAVLGGLCGFNSGTISNCYFLDPGDGGGPDNGLGTALTETQMKQQNSFLGWDFVEIWNIGENQTHPYLRVYPAGDLNHDGRVDLYDFAITASHWLEGTGP